MPYILKNGESVLLEVNTNPYEKIILGFSGFVDLKNAAISIFVIAVIFFFVRYMNLGSGFEPFISMAILIIFFFLFGVHFITPSKYIFTNMRVIGTTNFSSIDYYYFKISELESINFFGKSCISFEYPALKRPESVQIPCPNPDRVILIIKTHAQIIKSEEEN